MSSFTNRLQFASSPYLIQHQHNPVDWFEWSEEAFEKAKKENKPIFLSIGYATCHWCHVMAHESFEDLEVAEILNEQYVCIKLDREERPDLDHLYMTVCQVMNGHGGWPLSVFINHNKEPFYTATYIPKNGRNGRPGMMEILPKIASIWKNDKDKIAAYGQQIKSLLAETTDDKNNETTSAAELLKIALENCKSSFDAEYAGFGRAPKFPSAHNLEFLTRYSELSGELDGFFMVEESLKSMRYGGIYDQIGFGIHRYSTDREWLLPHFEKMLYDQAGLLAAWATHLPYCKEEVLSNLGYELLTYLNRDLKHPEGAFFSAEDADSEGEEGKFYVWDFKEIDSVIDEPDASWIKNLFNIKAEGNFRDEATNAPVAFNIPHMKESLSAISIDNNVPLSDTISRLNSIRKRLLAYRSERIRPLRDEKILTDWNAWLVRSLAVAFNKSKQHLFLEAAEETLSFIETHLIDSNRQLLHRFMNYSVSIKAMAPDYITLCLAYLSMYEATLQSSYLVKAVSWMEIAIDILWDDKAGGFYFAEEQQDLIARQKDFYDGASPSANSIAYHCLVKLSDLTSEVKWNAYAERLLASALPHIQAFPQGYLFLLQRVLENEHNQAHIILTSKEVTTQVDKWIDSLQKIRNKTLSIVYVNETNKNDFIAILPFIASIPIPSDKHKIIAYVCQNQSCGLPIEDLNDLIKELGV